MAKAIKNIGYLIYWNLEDSRVTPSKLRSLLASEGLSFKVPDINQGSAVKRVASNFTFGRGKADSFYSDKVHEDDASIDIGILKKVKRGAKESGADQVDLVTFDKGAGDWVSQGSTDAAARFVSRADLERNFLDHNFIRPHILQHTFDNLPGQMTLKSGVYFILPGHEDVTASLKRVLSQIGGCSLRSLKVDANDSETIEDARGIARGQVESGLKALMEQMTEWTAGARNNRPRRDAVSGVLNDFKELKVAAELYQDALEISLQDLTEQMESASEAARLLLGDDDEWRPSPKLVRIYSTFTEDEETYPVVDGVRRVPVADLEESGLSKSAFTHATYYSRTNSGGRALGSLGFRGTLSKGFLVIRPLTDRPVTEAADVAGTVTPEAEQDGPVTKLNSMTDEELSTAYTAVLGEESDALSREAMIEAILAA